MPIRLRNYSKVLISFCLVLTFCAVEGTAQTRKKKKSRRTSTPAAAKPVITNPPIAPATETDKTANGDVKIISTADSSGKESSSETPLQGWKPKVTPPVPTEQDEMQQSITTLTNQVNKLNDKLYYRHSGYPGGLRSRTLSEMLERRPEEVIRLAVKGMLPRNRLARQQLTKLKVYAGPEHPHEAQKPTQLEVEG